MSTLPIHHLADELRVLGFMFVMGLLGIIVCAMPFSVTLKEGVDLQILFSLRGTVQPPSEAVLVTIDRQSAQRLKLSLEIEKWPRHFHAQAVDRLRAEGAAVIVFDLLFSDPQPPSEDLRLAQAMRSAKNVVLAQALIRDSIPMTDRRGRTNGSLHIEKVAHAIPILAEAAMAQAPFPLPKIPIRLTQFWTFKSSAGDIPTLPVVAFHAYARRSYSEFIRLLRRLTPDNAALIPAPMDGEYTLAQILRFIPVLRAIFQQQPLLGRRMHHMLKRPPLSSLAAHTIRQIKSLITLYESRNSRHLNLYGPAATIRTIPYYRLIIPPPALPKGQTYLDVKGKVVFIGVTQSHTWPQIRDGFYTVYSQASGEDISGVELAASAFANLAENQKVWLPDWPVYLGVLMGWGVIIALISWRLHAAAAAATLSAVCGFYLWEITVQFAATGLWLPVAIPLAVQMPIAYLSALGRKYCRLKTERQNIRTAFDHFLPDPVVDKLTRDINYLHDGGQILYGICLMTDAEKYTNLSESMDPKALTILMNRYYQAIFEPIKANDGLILQVVGDAVLAIWTAPHADLHLSAKACAAALGIDASVRQFNTQAAERQLPTRIGMHAGYILLGNIGAMDHFEYRPVGDIVNTASRLEGLNKYLGTRLLISEEIHRQLDGFRTRCMGKFVFVGKSKPNQVYELVDFKDSTDLKQQEAHHHFGLALDAFHKQNWDAARQSFQRVETLIGSDAPSEFYLKLCDAYSRCPPESDWDGTIYMKQK